MTTASKRRVRRSSAWFWRGRGSLPPIICEQQGDGRWLVIMCNREVGIVANRTMAEQLAARLASKESQ